jgi:hypothetical protein
MAKKYGCYIGRHRWTTKAGATTLTCYYCGKSRPVGKALRCHLGLHRWAETKTAADGERYRECLYCRKDRGGRAKFFAPP